MRATGMRNDRIVMRMFALSGWVFPGALAGADDSRSEEDDQSSIEQTAQNLAGGAVLRDRLAASMDVDINPAAAEVIADYTDGWQLGEEYLVVPSGECMSHLRLLVYHRCEDNWVSPDA